MRTRRAVLGLGLASAVVGVVGALGLARKPTIQRTPSSKLNALSRVEFSILAAAADRLCPTTEGLPTAGELGVAERVDEVLWACHPGVAHELSQGLRVLESAFTGFLFEGRTVPFTACSPEQQDAILDAWRRSGLPLRRTVYKAIRGLVVSAYWSSPGVYAYLEYPGPPAYR